MLNLKKLIAVAAILLSTLATTGCQSTGTDSAFSRFDSQMRLNTKQGVSVSKKYYGNFSLMTDGMVKYAKSQQGIMDIDRVEDAKVDYRRFIQPLLNKHGSKCIPGNGDCLDQLQYIISKRELRELRAMRDAISIARQTQEENAAREFGYTKQREGQLFAELREMGANPLPVYQKAKFQAEQRIAVLNDLDSSQKNFIMGQLNALRQAQKVY